MPKIKGLVERKHRPLWQCHLCSEDPQAQCQRCKVWFCKKHLVEHDCVTVLLAQLDRTLEQLSETEDELYALQGDEE
jgi:hypothetical protein